MFYVLALDTKHVISETDTLFRASLLAVTEETKTSTTKIIIYHTQQNNTTSQVYSRLTNPTLETEKHLFL